jgi:hypothetical protein
VADLVQEVALFVSEPVKIVYPNFSKIIVEYTHATLKWSFCYYLKAIGHVFTFIVSNGCPDATVQTPPKPPARKFLVADVLCFSDILDHYV